MKNRNDKSFILKDYQKKKPFSSFLSGIAGKEGKPLWSFYVNRGQLITSFGIRDKNGAIMEFYPANLAYTYTPVMGFRTFVKHGSEVYELFLETNSKNQEMIIDFDKVAITEFINELNISVKVTYFILPNETIAGLVRKVEITNLDNKEKDLIIVDGMPQILPSGIDYGGYKAVSNLLQSWMVAKPTNEYMFYKLSSSTADTEEVSNVDAGNFYLTKTNSFKDVNYLYDYKALFNNDYSFKTPYGLISGEIENFPQTTINQVPAAMTILKETLKETSLSFISVIGHATDENSLKTISDHLSFDVLNQKELESFENHVEILSDVELKSNYPIFDNYLKQSYLDNLMRGGRPLLIETKEGTKAYHLYSRKHGDIERDYNFFSLEPSYYSQGNGNFRDVLQNRRNDILFYPEIKDFNIYQFGSLIQADGYNPLSIEGVKLEFTGNLDNYPSVKNIIKNLYTFGPLVLKLKEHNELHLLDEIIKESKIVIAAEFGEGYWQDHFTYIYDLLETYLAVYPEKAQELLYLDHKYLYFNSPVIIKDRSLKYVLNKQGHVRQYNAITHLPKPSSNWLTSKGEQIKVNLMGKLITLITNKYLALDQEGIGIMYEAGKPGWNDAMNGIPGLFGSGFGETIELLKLVKFVKEHLVADEMISMLKTTSNLVMKVPNLNTWDERVTSLEQYRKELLNEQEIIKIKSLKVIEAINKMETVLIEAVKKAKLISSVYPTYLTYEATKYQVLDEVADNGMPLVKVFEFRLKPVTDFLEGPARMLAAQISSNPKDIYEEVLKSELYDSKYQFYKTSKPLDNESAEIGRIKGFSAGWLERESNFLHMTYKYLLSLIKSELYDEFYNESKTNLTCFMDPKVYGRNPLENSSFIVPSNGLDITKHGQGFFARLSGSNAEFLSIWRYLFLGKEIFKYENDELVFELNPKIHHSYFKDGLLETLLFRNIKITYINNTNLNTYDNEAYIEKMEVIKDSKTINILGSKISGQLAHSIRQIEVDEIKVYINKK